MEVIVRYRYAILMAMVFCAFLSCDRGRMPASPDPITSVPAQAQSSPVLSVEVSIKNDFGDLKVTSLSASVSGSSVPLDGREVEIPQGSYEVILSGPFSGYDVDSTGCSGQATAGARISCRITLDDAEPACDPNLVQYVYLSSRLHGLDDRDCRVTAATVLRSVVEHDGDLDLLVHPDERSLPDELVVESICQYTPQTNASTRSCASYHGPRGAKASKGQRILAAGYLVTDHHPKEQHKELHPARIVVIGETMKVSLK